MTTETKKHVLTLKLNKQVSDLLSSEMQRQQRTDFRNFVAEFLGWNVTEALGGGRVAVRPDGLRFEPARVGKPGALQAGALPPGSAQGTVGARTFRRDHFLVQVDLADGSALHVAVGIDGQLPDVGATVVLTAGPDAVVPLPE